MTHSVLIIDDEPGIVALCETALGAAGYETGSASDGAEALGIITSTQFDLLIIDAVMPEMDGLELIRHVRRDWPALPVIVMSGAGDFSTYLRAGELLGATWTLVKPFPMADLISAVDRALRKKSA
ncbi:MAG TPA: response regulator [Dehalococcoidia bacterium]|nr:response regulator [Dehalococcoidia bacterium]